MTMTTPDEAKRTAMAYAWGREDQGSAKTVTPGGQVSGDWAFSEAYAQGQDDFNAQRRHDMIPVRDAWENWQASNGLSVFPRGELTLDDARRGELRAVWPTTFTSSDPAAYTAYWALRERLQADAWTELESRQQHTAGKSGS